MAEGEEHNLLVAIFLQQRDRLAARIARLLLNPDDVEEVLQETFLRAHVAESQRTIDTPKAYLYTIARNLAYKRISAQSKLVTKEIEDIDDRILVCKDPPADDIVHYQSAYQNLIDAVETLPPQCRKVFLLRKFYGLSQKEIAKELGISPSTVERHITNAIKRCHNQMQRDGYGVREEKIVVAPVNQIGGQR